MKIWIFLGIAILFEVAGTSMLKASAGFTKMAFAGGAMLAYWVSFWFLSIALVKIPVGVAYAIWSGAGICLITVIGWLVFRQSLSMMQIGFIGLILVGAIGLNLSTDLEAAPVQTQT
ncbi:MAG: multidrug efflux SMR transporter [Sphingomonadales bacterium]|nr:multidrug efflux SMR transporter [Sphingomonadales bacterium]PIX64084.1 MAG: ligand-binding protein SH3 [Sphingomonadales bacterium CG_4_10_14_3_um_filter_58_15]NCO49055.1 multidrug efflux SMR transporter [Sphingomonadales bacterium]NCO99410.1 multidrug efflux SMR transporter [Sphingomonadales bacterium]NCP27062.1 multidrug efflux SMR transporter [Sphingomonadales bacterium]